MLARLAVSLGEEDAVHGLVALSRDLGLSGGLQELGFTDAGIEQAAQMVAEVAPRVPKPVTVDDIAAILEHAMWMSVR